MLEEGVQKVVVAFTDGTRERGLVHGFRPYGEIFTLHPPDDTTGVRGKDVLFEACKALFFVKSHEGNREYRENKTSLPPVYRQGRKIEITFGDGEEMVGTTEGFTERRKGFVFFPADPKSNNLEVFVITENCEEIRIPGGGPNGTDKVIRKKAADDGLFIPEKRLEAVLRVIRGEDLETVAKSMFIPKATLMGWQSLYLSGGPKALGVE